MTAMVASCLIGGLASVADGAICKVITFGVYNEVATTSLEMIDLKAYLIVA